MIFVRLGWFVCLADRCRSLVWSVRLKSSWFMWGILKRPNCSGCRDLLLTLEVPGYHSHRCPLLFSCVLPCSSHFLFVLPRSPSFSFVSLQTSCMHSLSIICAFDAPGVRFTPSWTLSPRSLSLDLSVSLSSLIDLVLVVFGRLFVVLHWEGRWCLAVCGCWLLFCFRGVIFHYYHILVRCLISFSVVPLLSASLSASLLASLSSSVSTLPISLRP